RTKVIPEIRKALEQSYINEIPKGLFDGTLDEDEIPIKIDQKAYRARLKGYVLGAGKSKLNKLAEKSPAVKQILARMSKLEDYLGGPINAERLQKLKSLKTKDERAKRIYDIFVDDTDRLVNKVLDSGENEKFWSILAESGVNKDELIKRHLDAKMSDFAKDEKDITARANALVTTFMKKIEAKYGDAKNLLNVGGLPETPQEFVDDMFSKVIEAFISESYRTLGIRKRDKSQGEASAKSSYGHRQRDLIDHMFFVVNKRVDDYIKSRMKKTDPHGRKGGEGELDPQKDFLEEGDAFRSQQTKNWVDQIPDLSKSFTEVQADIEQFDLFSKDFEKFMSILERKARSDKSMKNVLSAFKGLA
ncbi:hypothetical protein EBS02_12430, partial [bacterium]|nr:hypothetical protein [bacterium]